jgi:hypothetical protein
MDTSANSCKDLKFYLRSGVLGKCNLVLADPTWWLACCDCGFESRQGHGCVSLVTARCCQVEVSASGCSLSHRSPTECGVSECGRESSVMRRPWPTTGCCAMVIKKFLILVILTFNFQLVYTIILTRKSSKIN